MKNNIEYEVFKNRMTEIEAKYNKEIGTLDKKDPLYFTVCCRIAEKKGVRTMCLYEWFPTEAEIYCNDPEAPHNILLEASRATRNE